MDHATRCPGVLVAVLPVRQTCAKGSPVTLLERVFYLRLDAHGRWVYLRWQFAITHAQAHRTRVVIRGAGTVELGLKALQRAMIAARVGVLNTSLNPIM